MKTCLRKTCLATLLGCALALALDAQDRPHISYYERMQGQVRYATAPRSPWVWLNLPLIVEGTTP